MKSAVLYGSDSGATEAVAEKIAELLGAECLDVAKCEADVFENYDFFVFGSSTQGVGDVQDDWDDFLGKIDDVNLEGKKVAIFGTGDGVGYADSFVDAMVELYDVAKEKGAEIIGGNWPSDGYDFSDSRALQDDAFLGLPIDEDNQADLTDERCEKWVEALKAALA